MRWAVRKRSVKCVELLLAHGGLQLLDESVVRQCASIGTFGPDIVTQNRRSLTEYVKMCFDQVSFHFLLHSFNYFDHQWRSDYTGMRARAIGQSGNGALQQFRADVNEVNHSRDDGGMVANLRCWPAEE